MLDDAARAALSTLAIEVRAVPAASYLVREGQPPRRCAFLLEGYSYRQKFAVDGGRALVSLQVPGDFIDLSNLFLDESDHDVQTLTYCVVADIAHADLRALVTEHPAINSGFWVIGLIEASTTREWLLNVGRRDARARLAHLLCEITTRTEAVDGRDDTYTLPMTQEQLGDALGLTAVHVNRVLKGLERDGLIARRKREVTIVDIPLLRRAADFNDRYLHLDARASA